MKIIFADDHTLFRAGMRHLLSQLDHELVLLEAADHEGAAKLAAEHPDADLLLMDLAMPGQNPYAAIKELRNRHPTLPIVVMSATNEAGEVQRTFDSGAMGFIPKHETAPVMLSALRLVLSGGIYMPPLLMQHTSGAALSAGVNRLTPRQLEVLHGIAEGKSNKEIGRAMGLSEATVKAHVMALYRALNVDNRVAAAQAAKAKGLLEDRSP
jgi:DNA-binding NarL/FixJ family response regulator